MASIWKFRLQENHTYSSNHPIESDKVFRCPNAGQIRLMIAENGDITVIEGYAWDGISPKFPIFDWGYIGTPDGTLDWETGKPLTWEASLIHDALYQFLEAPEMPYTRREMDEIFLEILTERGFSLRWIYFITTRALGSFYLKLVRSFR